MCGAARCGVARCGVAARFPLEPTGAEETVNLVAEAALWLAVLSAAWTAGSLLARWRSGDGGTVATGYAMLATAAFLVLSWGALAGALLRQDPSLAIVHEGLPVGAGALHRLAAAWSTARGALLTVGTLLALGGVVLAADDSHRGSTAATRLAGSLAALVALVLVVGALTAPPFAGTADAHDPAIVPLYLLNPAAAVAPLFALGTIAALLILACNVLSVRGTAAPESADDSLGRTVMAGWLMATLTLAAEQAARARLGITTREAVVLGSSSSALVLWVALGALTLPRVRRLLLRTAPSVEEAPPASWPWRVAHIGALLLVLGFALHIAAARSNVRLSPGEATAVADVFGREWRLVNQGLSRFDAEGYDVTALAVEVTPPAGGPTLVSTELRQYYSGRTGTPMGSPVGVRAVLRGIVQDLRVVLDDAAREGDVAMVRVSFVPLALLWHAGVALLLIGGLVVLVVPGRSTRSTEGAA